MKLSSGLWSRLWKLAVFLIVSPSVKLSSGLWGRLWKLAVFLIVSPSVKLSSGLWKLAVFLIVSPSVKCFQRFVGQTVEIGRVSYSKPLGEAFQRFVGQTVEIGRVSYSKPLGEAWGFPAIFIPSRMWRLLLDIATFTRWVCVCVWCVELLSIGVRAVYFNVMWFRFQQCRTRPWCRWRSRHWRSSCLLWSLLPPPHCRALPLPWPPVCATMAFFNLSL